MSVDPRYVAAILFEALDLGPPPSDATEAESFEVDDARCTILRAPSGTEVTLKLEIGSLAREPHAAADRLRRLMRSSLGLAVVNRASLICDNPPDEAGLRALQSAMDGAPTLQFSAVARINSARRDEIINALQDVVQVRNIALQYLVRAETGFPDDPVLNPASPRTSPKDEDGGAFLIFQP